MCVSALKIGHWAKAPSAAGAPRPVTQLVNATGAGDAFLAGFTHALVDGLPVEDMLDYALASGITAIQSMTTINPDMSDARVKENIARYRL